MNETTTTPNVITDEHVAAINAARDALKEIVKSADHAAWYAPTNAGIGDTPYAQWYGAVGALADRAADSLFDLLNTALSMRIIEIDDDRLFNRPEDEGDGREPDGVRVEGGRIVPTDR